MSEKVEILKGMDIRKACWQYALLSGKVPLEIAKNPDDYTATLLCTIPGNKDQEGTFDDVKFVVKRKDADGHPA